MRRRTTIMCSGPIVAVMLAAAWTAGAQQPAAVPIEQEPMHKIVFKNDFARIIDATLPPGYVTLNHTHAADSIAVTIALGREGTAGARGLGRAAFSKGGYSHSVTNSGTSNMRFIVVEPFKSDRPGAAAAVLPKHVLETENDRARIYRAKLDAAESLENHTHGAGWVEVTVTGGAGPGSYVWTSAGEAHPLKAGSAALEVVEIEPK